MTKDDLKTFLDYYANVYYSYLMTKDDVEAKAYQITLLKMCDDLYERINK